MAFTFSDWQRGIEPWRPMRPPAARFSPMHGTPCSTAPPVPRRRNRVIDGEALPHGKPRRALAPRRGRPRHLAHHPWAVASSLNSRVQWRKTPTGGLERREQLYHFRLLPSWVNTAWSFKALAWHHHHHRPVPRGRSSACRCWKAHCPGRQQAPGTRTLGAHRCAGQLRGGRAANLPVRVGPGAQQVPQFATTTCSGFTPPRHRGLPSVAK